MTRSRKTAYSGRADVGAATESPPQFDYLCGHFPVAVAVPGRHQRPPTLEQIAASVAAFDRALYAMPQHLLDHLVWKARSFVAPIFQARAKTVRHRRRVVVDSLEHFGQYPLANGVGTNWLAVAEHRRLGVAARGQLPRNGERPADERHALIPPQVLHTKLRDHPLRHRRAQIELGTARRPHCIEAHAAENDHLQEPCRQALRLTKLGHERRYFREWEGRLMLHASFL